MTTRSDFERLTDLRMAEARFLLDDKNDWDGAYYLVGYAVEFAFKVCIIKQVIASDGFPPKKDASDFYSHNLVTLRRLAALDIEMELDPGIKSAWQIIGNWSEQSRYVIGTTEQAARDLCDAIEHEVLPWIKARW